MASVGCRPTTGRCRHNACPQDYRCCRTRRCPCSIPSWPARSPNHAPNTFECSYATWAQSPIAFIFLSPEVVAAAHGAALEHGRQPAVQDIRASGWEERAAEKMAVTAGTAVPRPQAVVRGGRWEVAARLPMWRSPLPWAVRCCWRTTISCSSRSRQNFRDTTALRHELPRLCFPAVDGRLPGVRQEEFQGPGRDAPPRLAGRGPATKMPAMRNFSGIPFEKSCSPCKHYPTITGGRDSPGTSEKPAAQ